MNGMTVNIALPRLLVQEADVVAKQEFRNRSELIREALWKYLNDRARWQNLFAYGKQMGKKVGIKSTADVDKIVYGFRHTKSNGHSS